MNVLPGHTLADASALVRQVSQFASVGAEGGRRMGAHQLVRDGKLVLSTFSGGDARFGGDGWKGVLGMLEAVGFKVTRTR